MSLFGNLFNFNIKNLIIQGRVDIAYDKIYNMAEKITVHELKLHQSNLVHKYGTKAIQGKNYNLLEEVSKLENWKFKRIQYHINEMKELLKLREKLKENKG